MTPSAQQRIARGFLIGALWAGAALSAASPEAEARAAAWLEAWDGQPNHRTATAGDEAGAAWLAREVEAIAGPVISETFRIDRIDTTAAYVEIDGRERIAGEPFFDGPPTGPAGVGAIAGDAVNTSNTTTVLTIVMESSPLKSTDAGTDITLSRLEDRTTKNTKRWSSYPTWPSWLRNEYVPLEERAGSADDRRFGDDGLAILYVRRERHRTGAGWVFDEHQLRRTIGNARQRMRRTVGKQAGGCDADGGEDTDGGVGAMRDEGPRRDHAALARRRQQDHLRDRLILYIAKVHHRAHRQADGFDLRFELGVLVELITRLVAGTTDV